MSAKRIDGHEELSGDLRSVEVRPEKAEDLKLACTQGVDNALVAPRPLVPGGNRGQEAADVARARPFLGEGLEQADDGVADVGKGAHVSLWLGESHGPT